MSEVVLVEVSGLDHCGARSAGPCHLKAALERPWVERGVPSEQRAPFVVVCQTDQLGRVWVLPPAHVGASYPSRSDAELASASRRIRASCESSLRSDCR